MDEQPTAYSLEELEQKDPVLFSNVLGNIINSEKEGSEVKERFESLAELRHKLATGMNIIKASFELLEMKGVKFPENFFHYTTETKIVDDQEITVRKKGNMFGETMALVEGFCGDFASRKMAVGVGLESIFRQLSGEEVVIPEGLKYEDIILLGLRRIRRDLKRDRKRLCIFFRDNPIKDDLINDPFRDLLKLKKVMMGGIRKTIVKVNNISQEFFGPEKPQEPGANPGSESPPVGHA